MKRNAQSQRMVSRLLADGFLTAGSVAMIAWVISMREHIPFPTGHLVLAGAIVLLLPVAVDLHHTWETLRLERDR